MPPRVYLTGFMGVGKSTVGRLVARALGYRFADLDARVEARAGRSVADLLADSEDAFRAAEADALGATTRETGLVVATGGGTVAAGPHAEANRSVARPAVWLRVPTETLSARLARGAAARPLLHGPAGPLAGDALAARVAALIDARTPFYATADANVDADAPPAVVASRVVDAVRALGDAAR